MSKIEEGAIAVGKFGSVEGRLAVRNRGYPNETHLRGLKKGWQLVRDGGLCSGSREFDSPGVHVVHVEN